MIEYSAKRIKCLIHCYHHFDLLQKQTGIHPFTLVVFLLWFLSAPDLVSADNKDIIQKPAIPKELIINASASGPIFNIEFMANTSRLNAFIEISKSESLMQSRSSISRKLPEGYFNALYPYFRRLRIGNLFFGHECRASNGGFEEMAVRDSDGTVKYQFGLIIQLLEELLRGGLKPHFALTGIPKAMIPNGEKVVSHPAYGCVNAPEIDWSKNDPKARVPAWWHLQDAFFSALIAHFGIDEVRSWSFSTWSEPWNPQRKLKHHLVLPQDVIDQGFHDAAVATIIAASIDAAMAHGLPISIGNLSGPVERIYPKLVTEIRRFSNGNSYLKYIQGYAISRYHVRPEQQDIGMMLDRAFTLLSNPTMPEKPIYIDELGELAGQDGLKPFEPAVPFEQAAFMGSVLARVFNRQDGSIRVPKRVAFWNNHIRPRAKNAFTRFDDYLKTPATNIMGMFASLNGYRKIDVDPASTIAAAGVRNGQVKVILLKSPDGTGLTAKKRQNHKIKEIVIRGLKAKTHYNILLSLVNARHGNPISVFLGEGAGLRKNSGDRFTNNGKKWQLAPGYWTKCFYDEIKECEWRSKADRFDSPLMRLTQITADESGALKVPISTNHSLAMMLDIAEAVEGCVDMTRPIALNFDIEAECLAKVNFKALDNVSFDAGYSTQRDLIRNDERNHGLRFFAGARVVLPCSPLSMWDGHLSMRFKIDKEFHNCQMTLFQQGEIGKNGLRVVYDNRNLYVEQNIGGKSAEISLPVPENHNEMWNSLKVVIQNGVLNGWLNDQSMGTSKLIIGRRSEATDSHRKFVYIGSSPDFDHRFSGVIDDLWIGSSDHMKDH